MQLIDTSNKRIDHTISQSASPRVLPAHPANKTRVKKWWTERYASQLKENPHAGVRKVDEKGKTTAQEKRSPMNEKEQGLLSGSPALQGGCAGDRRKKRCRERYWGENRKEKRQRAWQATNRLPLGKPVG